MAKDFKPSGIEASSIKIEDVRVRLRRSGELERAAKFFKQPTVQASVEQGVHDAIVLNEARGEVRRVDQDLLARKISV